MPQITWAKKKWLLIDPETRHQTVLATLKKVQGLLSEPYAIAFSQRMMASLVYISNVIENTLPEGAEQHQMFDLIGEIAPSINHTSFFEEPSTTWSADGDDSGANLRAQLLQHMRAARYLLDAVNMPLTLDIVKQTHKLLMAGAIDEYGVLVRAGEFRDHPAHAGMHAFPEGDPEKLYAALSKIVDAFNDSMMACDDTTLITAPTRLLYDTITLHPFENGNGRLCRLLFAFAVRKAGVPFPVPFSTGHKKACKHYMRAIFRAQRGEMDELNTMTLMSIDAVLSDFNKNTRIVCTD